MSTYEELETDNCTFTIKGDTIEYTYEQKMKVTEKLEDKITDGGTMDGLLVTVPIPKKDLMQFIFDCLLWDELVDKSVDIFTKNIMANPKEFRKDIKIALREILEEKLQ